MFRSTILTLSALGLAAAADAQVSRPEAFELAFQYAPALLETAAGAQEVMEAIEIEASKACTSEKVIAGRSISREDRGCARDVTARLVTAIGEPKLEAAYEGSDYFVSPRRRRLLIASR